MRSLPGQEIRVDFAMGQKEVGTMSMTPSGRECRLFAGIDEGALELVVGRKHLGLEAQLYFARFTVQTFSGRKLSGPASTRQSPIFSVRILPPMRWFRSSSRTSTVLPWALAPCLEMDCSREARDTAADDDDFRHMNNLKKR